MKKSCVVRFAVTSKFGSNPTLQTSFSAAKVAAQNKVVLSVSDRWSRHPMDTSRKSIRDRW
jgi:hypothetical protein